MHLVRVYVRLCCIDQRLQILGAAMGRDGSTGRELVAEVILLLGRRKNFGVANTLRGGRVEVEGELTDLPQQVSAERCVSADIHFSSLF